jgi:hypothetical protein
MGSLRNIVNHRTILCEAMFCTALLAIFLPVKIYPVIFLAAVLCYFLDTPTLLRHVWVWCLAVFTGYASLMFLTSLPADSREMTNFLKLPVNFLYLYAAVGWMAQRDNGRLLRWVDVTLHVALGLTLLQLLIYHDAAGFQWIDGAPSSAKGSSLYRASLYFWGLDDKNMFGARIALLGFTYVLLPAVSRQVLSWGRIAIVLALAWLSLSRTPVVALLLGVFCLLWAASTVRWRFVLAAAALAAIPFVAQKVIRIENITASNDGMGVRLVYWKAFFEHFTTISPLGNGFMAGRGFLGQYAAFYHGEPHIHNTFLNCYLDFGLIGFLSYVLFLYYFYRFCVQQQPGRTFWWVASIPLLAIMMILYSGYDNDIIIYLVLVFLLGAYRPTVFRPLKGGIV